MARIRSVKTSLLSASPELVNEWHPSKNGELTPQTVSYGSGRKVWWLGKCGHEWEASVRDRVHGRGCPYCSKNKLLKGWNDLLSVNPALASEWNEEKNAPLTPSDIMPSSGRKVWWKCIYGHEWQASPNGRKGNVGCPLCSSKGSSKPEQTIAFYISQCCEIKQRVKLFEYEVDVYIPEYNIGIEYDGLYYHRKKKTKDTQKTLALTSNGIRLFRIIESDHNSVDEDTIFFETDYLGPNYIWAVKSLFSCLTDITHNESFRTIDIDVQRDNLQIRERYDLIRKENSLAYLNPTLAKEWNSEKNGALTPDMFDYYSNEKVWWKCDKGHEWKAMINNRAKGKNCPYCSNRKVLLDFNDLASQNEELAKEWNYEKNGTLLPTQVVAYSNKKVWWKCSKGHEWQNTISHRTDGQGCPICSHKKLCKKENDLATTNPKLASEWNYERNEGLLPSDFIDGANVKVWWKCLNGHEWQATINNRSNKSHPRGCPYCSNQKVWVGFNDLASKKQDLVKEWNKEKNGELQPNQVTVSSGKKVWWKCSKGHEWEAVISSRTNGCGCPFCSGRRAVRNKNDLTSTNPELALEWNYEKNNGLSPEDVTPFSNKKVWWKCSKGHEWQAVIGSRVRGCGCPYCQGKRAIVGKTDLSTTNKALVKEWNYEKNAPLIPEEFSAGSTKKVWWKCAKGHEWQAIIGNRANKTHPRGCPYCSGRKK